MEFRFRPQLRVSDEQVRAAFESDPRRATSFEAEKESIRERLERRALDERVEAWVRELRARADVRYVGRESPAGGRSGRAPPPSRIRSRSRKAKAPPPRPTRVAASLRHTTGSSAMRKPRRRAT